MSKSSFKKIKFSLVYNRNSVLNQDGTALIQIKAYHAGKARYFSTGVYVEPECWDEKNKRVKESHPCEIKYNKHIQDEIQALKEFERAMLQRYEACPLSILDDYKQEAEEEKQETFTSFYERELKDRPDLGKGTRKSHKYSLALVSAYKKKVHFEDLTYSFVIGFNRFLHHRGLKLNTIDKHHRVLKAYINSSIKYGYFESDKNPYKLFKSKKEEPDRVYLTEDELKKIEQLEIPEDKKHLEKTRRFFLLSCYTGLRFGDVKRLARKHTTETVNGMELNLRMEKSRKTICIPLWVLFNQGSAAWSKPEQIIRDAIKAQGEMYRRRSLETAPFFRVTNQYLNRSLKELAKLAGIKKKITSHVGRHTLASILAPKVEVAVLKELLGHSNLRMTEIYVHLSKKAMVEELRKIKWDEKRKLE